MSNVLIEVQKELSSLRSEVTSLRKHVKAMAEKQDELLNLVKAMKKSSDSENFDLSKYCHTLSSTNMYVYIFGYICYLSMWLYRLILFNRSTIHNFSLFKDNVNNRIERFYCCSGCFPAENPEKKVIFILYYIWIEYNYACSTASSWGLCYL